MSKRAGLHDFLLRLPEDLWEQFAAKAKLERSMTIRSAGFIVLVLSTVSCGADWPQFLGPQRNGSSPEKGLLASWSEKGPKVLWKVEGGDGYSGIAIANGRAFTLVQRGGQELAIALDAGSGKEMWKYVVGPAYKNQFGDGPRSTPTVDGERVYVQSVNGPLVCLGTASGSLVWQQDLLKEFGAKNINWGLSASPLVEGDVVLAVPGGKGAGVAAFNKATGKVIWKVGDDKASYASPIIMSAGGKKQAIFFTAAGLLAVQPTDGAELWRVPWKTEFDVNIATPLVVGEQVFVSSGENVGCAMLAPGAGKPKIVWESKGPKSIMKNYWATAVYHDKHLYGISGEYEGVANLNCVEAATGKLVWSRERFGRANLTLADGNLYIVTITGDLVVAPATPSGYQEKGRAPVLEKARYVNAPAIADKKAYVRDLKHIVCLDLAGK